MAVLSLILALVVGSIVGIMRTLPNKAAVVFGNAWTQFFRNIPLLVQIFLWYHVIPSIFLVVALDPELRAGRVRARLLHLVAHFRAGARRHPDAAAGPALRGPGDGPHARQTYRYVLLPMAYRIIIPPLTSEAMNIFKNTSVAFAVSIAELTMFALQASEETSRFEEIFIPVTFLYFISAYAINRIAAVIEKSVRVPGILGAK